MAANTLLNSEKVLYGGPDSPSIDTEAKSLGEVALKKLAENGNEITFVSKVGCTLYTSCERQAQLCNTTFIIAFRLMQ